MTELKRQCRQAKEHLAEKTKELLMNGIEAVHKLQPVVEGMKEQIKEEKEHDIPRNKY